MNLVMVKVSEKGKITRIGSLGPFKRRLMDMGVLVGEEIGVKIVAPLGDPIEVTIKATTSCSEKSKQRGLMWRRLNERTDD